MQTERTVSNPAQIAEIRAAFTKSSRLNDNSGAEPEDVLERGTRVNFVPLKGEEIEFEILEDQMDESWGPEVANMMRKYRKKLLTPQKKSRRKP